MLDFLKQKTCHKWLINLIDVLHLLEDWVPWADMIKGVDGSWWWWWSMVHLCGWSVKLCIFIAVCLFGIKPFIYNVWYFHMIDMQITEPFEHVKRKHFDMVKTYIYVFSSKEGIHVSKRYGAQLLKRFHFLCRPTCLYLSPADGSRVMYKTLINFYASILWLFTFIAM